MAYLPYIQVVLSLLLVAGVMLQRSDSDLGAGFGGDSSFGGGTRFMRRGFEKFLFNATIFISILFVASTVLPLFVR